MEECDARLQRTQAAIHERLRHYIEIQRKLLSNLEKLQEHVDDLKNLDPLMKDECMQEHIDDLKEEINELELQLAEL